MKLELSNNRTIQEVQHDFTSQYPFLKLEFYRIGLRKPGTREHLPDSFTLKTAGLKLPGFIDISNNVTVGEVEKIFNEDFGLIAQVSRYSGGVWLETTMTDKWSLHKQNEYGKEIIKKTKIDLAGFDQSMNDV